MKKKELLVDAEVSEKKATGNGSENNKASSGAEPDLAEQLAAAKADAASYYDQLVRLRAEFENYRKRSEREKENHRQFGKEEMLLKQIHLYDIIDSALEQIKEDTKISEIINGLKMIKDEFVKVLKSESIQEIEAVGLMPDPHRHEVVAKIPVSDEKQEGRIVAVVQRGFTINGRLLRPAKVCVAVVSPNIGVKERKESEDGDSGGGL